MLQGYRRAIAALAALALALVLVPASTDVEAQPAPVEITQLCRHLYTGQLRYAPPSQVCTPGSETVFMTLENFPYTICANVYTRTMRIPTAAGCSPGELTLTIPDDLPIYFCITPATGKLAYTFGPTACPAGQFLGTINLPSPDLEDDAYDSLGNVGIEVAAAVDGLFANDDLEGGTLDTYDAISSQGGTVVVNADGTFEYTPPPGFEGDDTFTYTVTNASGSDTTTVTITVIEVIWFIDDSAPGPGDGTIVNPFNTIASFNNLAADEPGDTIFVYAGNYGFPFAGLQDEQQLIGQGVDLVTVTGFVPPPFSRPLPGATVNPVIDPSPGETVPLADNNLITGLTLNGSTNGISALAGATGTTIDRVTISNMTGNGIIIQPSTDTTISNMQFTNNGADIALNAVDTTIQDVTSTNPATGIDLQNISGFMLIERIDITGASIAGIQMNLAQAGADIDVIDVTLAESSGGGLRVLNSAAGSDFDFDNFCVCSSAPTSGVGLFFDTNAGAFNFDAASAVDNETNHAFSAEGNSMTLTYNGDITESSIEFFRVVNDTSTLTFQNGTLQATGSDRMLFENADGTYDFLGTTTLTGMLDGVVILNSDGDFTFGPDASILLAVLNYGLRVEGGIADIDYAGTIDIFSSGGSAVSVAGAHTGTLTFQPASLVAASVGDGLQFDDADGLYDFLGAVQLINLVPDDAGVDILGNSNGTFTFSADAVITNPSGDAFHVAGDGTNSPTITYSGTITNDANDIIEISNTVGPNTITFDSAASAAINDTSAGTGIYLNGVGQNVNFTAAVVLMGAEGVDIDGGSGAFSFTETIITDTTAGPALALDGGSTVSNFLIGSSIGQAQFQSAVLVTGGHTGTLTYDGTINATSGDGLQFNDADGNYNFNVSSGTTTLNGGDAGIDLVNFTDGVFVFTNPTITNPGPGPAINIQQGIAQTTFNGMDVDTNGTPGLVADSTDLIVVSNASNPATIDSSGAPAIDLNATSELAMSFTSVNSLNSTAEGIDIDGIISAASTFTVDDGNAGTSNDATISNSVNSGIDISNSAGAFTFAGLDIDTTGIDGVTLTGSFAATVNLQAGEIDGTTGDGINSTATGTLNIGTLAPSGVVFGGTQPIGANGIFINSTGAAPQSATVLNSSSPSTAAINSVGIVLSAAGPGTLVATFDGNDIKSTDHALQTVDGGTAEALHVALNANAWESGAGVDTMELVGAGLNSTVVTSLSSGGTGNTVVANGTNGGVLFDQITFDANPGSAGIQQVAGGTTEIGQNAGGPAAAGERVQGDGLAFLAPTGNLDFGQLDIANNAGTGLLVDTKSPPGPTTFMLTGGGSGNIDTTGGPAMFLDPLTTGLTFGTVISDASTTGQDISNGTGLTLDQVAGTLDISTLMVTNPANEGLFVNGSTGIFTIRGGSISGADYAAAVRVDNLGAPDTSTLTYDGSITNTAGLSVLIEDKTSGAVTLGGALNDTGAGVLVQNNSGGTVIDFDGTSEVFDSGANQAVTLTNKDGATVSPSNGGLDIDTGGAAIGFNATGGTVNVTCGNTPVSTIAGTRYGRQLRRYRSRRQRRELPEGCGQQRMGQRHGSFISTRGTSSNNDIRVNNTTSGSASERF